MKRCLLCLRELPVFQGLSRSEFSKVCLSATKRHLAKGEILFLQGEPADTIYLIKRGKLKLVQVSSEGREMIIDVLGPGEVLGEMLFFQQQGQPCGAVALETAGLCCFSRQQLEALIQQNPGLAVDIITYLAQKLQESVRLAGQIAGIPVRERLLRLLTRLADKYGRQMAGATVIGLEITQQELADMVGASRVAVANALKELRAQGVLSRQGQHYWLAPDACTARHFSSLPAEHTEVGDEAAEECPGP